MKKKICHLRASLCIYHLHFMNYKFMARLNGEGKKHDVAVG